MTLRLAGRSTHVRARTDRSAVPTQTVAVEVLVCGSPDRGDDGAPIAAAAILRQDLPADVRVRIVGQLDIDDLLAVSADARVVIVDAAVGIRPGQVVELPLAVYVGRVDGLRPRSSHALAFPEVIGLAELIRGRPMRGLIVAMGGKAFGHGAAFSAPVARAMPALVAAIRNAIRRMRG